MDQAGLVIPTLIISYQQATPMNSKLTPSTPLLAGLTALCLFSSNVMANSIGIGIGVVSEYPGSDNYEAFPNAAFEIDTPIGTLKNNQIGAQLDIVKNDNLDTGPILRANFGRDDDIDDDVVRLLDEVDTGVELGWFINSGVKLSSLGIPSDVILIGRLEAATDVGDGHDGTLVNASLGLVFQLTDKFRLVPSIGLNYGDDSYTEAFYNVSSEGAAASGLDEFSASGGVEFTQLALFGVHTIDDRWSVSGTVAFNKLQGDAADSPITLRGTEDQWFTGFIVNYAY